MSAKIIHFPGDFPIRPPMTERQIRFDRMAELIQQRAQRKGLSCSIEKAKASLAKAIMGIKR